MVISTLPTVAETAILARSLGISAIRATQDGVKKPQGRWAHFQKRLPNDGETKSWLANWQDGSHTGIGLVCGQVSGNLEAVDFDKTDAYQTFLDVAQGVGLGDLVTRIEDGYLEYSPRGVHWLWHCEEIEKNLKLATNEDEKTLIETRGEGGFIVIAPSGGKVHPSGQDYLLVSGGLDTIPTITPEERASILDLARSLNQAPIKPAKPSSYESRPTTSSSNSDRPGDQFNQRASWPEILEPHGWANVFQQGDTNHWRRPGKAIGTSATTNYRGTDLLYVFSSSTDLPFEQGLTKFAAYSILNHSGDFGSAARDLASQGYGVLKGGRTPVQDYLVDESPIVGDNRQHHLTTIGEHLVKSQAIANVRGLLGAINAQRCQPPLDTAELDAISEKLSQGLSIKEMSDALGKDLPQEIYYQADIGPRNRLPALGSEGDFRKLRRRLREIWQENLGLTGQWKRFHDSQGCGRRLTGQCEDCGCDQADHKTRKHTCNQRLDPICHRTGVRKKLWKHKAGLDTLADEGRLGIYRVALGSFNIGIDQGLAAWTTGASDILNQCNRWISTLSHAKDAPPIASSNFAAVRTDLHRGWLTVDICFLGPISDGAEDFLTNHFCQATEREAITELIEVDPVKGPATGEGLPVALDTGDAIEKFSYLLALQATYGGVEECGAIMAAFRGRRLLQGRGNFLAKTRDVSNKTEENLLETSQAKVPPPPADILPKTCHDCGSTKIRAIGLKVGPFHYAIGRYSGKPFWALERLEAGGLMPPAAAPEPRQEVLV